MSSPSPPQEIYILIITTILCGHSEPDDRFVDDAVRLACTSKEMLGLVLEEGLRRHAAVSSLFQSEPWVTRVICRFDDAWSASAELVDVEQMFNTTTGSNMSGGQAGTTDDMWDGDVMLDWDSDRFSDSDSDEEDDEADAEGEDQNEQDDSGSDSVSGDSEPDVYEDANVLQTTRDQFLMLHSELIICHKVKTRLQKLSKLLDPRALGSHTVVCDHPARYDIHYDQHSDG